MPAATPMDAAEPRSNFLKMAVCFSINHACATAPLVYATSVLSKQVGFIGNALVYGVNIASGLLVAVPVLDRFGARGGLLVGMALYCVYASCFAIASFCALDSHAQWVFFLFGSSCAGLAAGILWTSQGGYFAHSASIIAQKEEVPQAEVTTQLAGQFAFYYLAFEVVSKLGFSALLDSNIKVWVIASGYSVAGVIALIMMRGVNALDAVEDAPRVECSEAVQLWRDIRLWLLSLTGITFGFSAAYLNGYFNAECATPTLSLSSIGYLTAATGICAAILSKVYGYLGVIFGKHAILIVGSLSFASIPILGLIFNCPDWGWGIICFYLLQGSGRAMYESTFRAILADTFEGRDIQLAFANVSTLMAASSAVMFILSGKISDHTLKYLVLVAALLTPPAYFAAIKISVYTKELGTRTPLLGRRENTP